MKTELNIRQILNKALRNRESLTAEERKALNFTNLGIETPIEIQSELTASKRPFKSMKQFVDVLPVKEKRGYYSANDENVSEGELQEFNETTPLTETNTTVKGVSWEVKKRGSLNKVSNSTVKDSGIDLVEVLKRSHGRKAVKTENKLIFQKLQEEITPATFGADPYSELTNSLISDVDPALESQTVIITNQSGLKALKKLKDADGKSLVKVLNVDKPRRYLDIYPVEAFSDAELPNIDNGDGTFSAPVFYGSFKESIKFFEYETMNVETNLHTEFLKDMLVIRGVEQFDVQKFGTPDYQYKLLKL